MARLLIINADDLGWSVPVNRGIIQCHTSGVVTSTTVMATMPGVEDALTRIGDCPDLGVGVHLTLTAGSPVSEDRAVRRALAPRGAFSPSLGRLMLAARTSKRWREAALAELSAQVQFLIDRGVRPDHIDSHKHFHVVPPFPAMVCRIAHEFNIPAIRSTVERRPVTSSSCMACFRRCLLAQWGRRAVHRYRALSLAHPQELFGIPYTGWMEDPPLRECLASSEVDSIEWMVHPGDAETEPPTGTRLLKSRPFEKKLLTNPEIRAIISASGFRLARFSELTR